MGVVDPAPVELRVPAERITFRFDTEDHVAVWEITQDLRGAAGGPITTLLFPEDEGLGAGGGLSRAQ